MKTKLLLLVLISFVVSCSPKIVDTWNVDSYEVLQENGQNMTSQNIGSITFKKNGKGYKNLNYNFFQNNYTDTEEFSWKLNKDDYIIIKESGKSKKDKSNLNKTWIIVENKAKTQVWKSTDGKNSVQILKLSK